MFIIPNISPQSTILGFMEEIQDQHNMIINHVLLIYKHYVYLSRNSGSLNFVGLKNYILETKISKEKIGRIFLMLFSFFYFRLLFFSVSSVLFDVGFDCKIVSLGVYTLDQFQHGNKKSKSNLKLF